MNKVLKVIWLVMLTVVMLVTGCASDSIPAPASPTYHLEVNLLGEKNECLINSVGRLKSKLEVVSADGKVWLSLNEKTAALNKDGEPLQLLNVIIDHSPPLPPENAYIIESVFNLEPQGATFNPWLTLTLSYDKEQLPEGVKEKELYIAYHNGAEWSELPYKNIDTNAHTVTTQIYHLTSFAILGPKEPPPPKAPEVGDPAPDFQFYNHDNALVSLKDILGNPILINFCSTGCPASRAELPYLQQVYEDWADQGLVVLSIYPEKDMFAAEELEESLGISFIGLIDVNRKIREKYNIIFVPTTFFIDKDGIIQDIKVGAFQNVAEIESILSKITS